MTGLSSASSNFHTSWKTHETFLCRSKQWQTRKSPAILHLYRPIHGNFWTGNILLKDVPLQKAESATILVVDWEMAQFGVPALDHGEMIGEMYALWLYRKIDAGLWMMQGYAEGLSESEHSDTSTWRTISSGWMPPSQLRHYSSWMGIA